MRIVGISGSVREGSYNTALLAAAAAELPTNFRNRDWKPAQFAAGIEPFRRIYDLRHTFATFALRAGISTFDLSRYMGASLTMIDRHYGHLARDGREHAIRLLDNLDMPRVDVRGRAVDSEPVESPHPGQREPA